MASPHQQGYIKPDFSGFYRIMSLQTESFPFFQIYGICMCVCKGGGGGEGVCSSTRYVGTVTLDFYVTMLTNIWLEDDFFG